MTIDQGRMERLATASAFCLYDKKLRSSGNASIVWGLFNALFGFAALSRESRWGLVTLILGLALIAAGLYERRVREPKVILLSAATLAGLSLYEFALYALALIGHVKLEFGGRTLFWAVAQAVGAFSTWKTFTTYKLLHENSDSLLVDQIRTYVSELKKTKPGQSVDVIEFEADAGFVEGKKRYRLKPMEDLYLVAIYKSQLGSLDLELIDFVPRTEVSLTPEREKWMSKKMRATVQLGSRSLPKVTITPEMAERINPAVRALAFNTTR